MEQVVFVVVYYNIAFYLEQMRNGLLYMACVVVLPLAVAVLPLIPDTQQQPAENFLKTTTLPQLLCSLLIALGMKPQTHVL